MTQTRVKTMTSYTNRQLRYYQFSSATLDTDTNDLKKRLDERKATLKAFD